jgi:hypothetical protein
LFVGSLGTLFGGVCAITVDFRLAPQEVYDAGPGFDGVAADIDEAWVSFVAHVTKWRGPDWCFELFAVGSW